MRIHNKTPLRRLDVASLCLTIIGLVSGTFAYMFISCGSNDALLLVPSVVAVTIGVTHLTKQESPRE